MKTAKEIIDTLAQECEENGYGFLVQIDDGSHISGQWSADTRSKLYNMVSVVKKIVDSYTETETK